MWTQWISRRRAAVTAHLARMAVSGDAQHARYKRSFLAGLCWVSVLVSLAVASLLGAQQPLFMAFYLLLAVLAVLLRAGISAMPQALEGLASLALGLCALQAGVLYLLGQGLAPRSGLLLLTLAATFYLKGRRSGGRMLWILLALVLGNSLFSLFPSADSPLDTLTVCLCLLAQYAVVRNYEHLRETQTNHLKALNTDLEAQIQQRTEQLAAAKTALEVEKELLKSVSSRDHLTGLHNRQHFETLFFEHMRKPQKKITDALILMDIDYFKKINDTHGHLVGDAVLKAVAQCLRSQIRMSDIAVRWGGDELMIYTPRTNEKQAAKLAEKIRQQILRLSIDSVGSITISVGVAGLVPGDSLAQLLERADNALYQAKQAGRNAVVTASGS